MPRTISLVAVLAEPEPEHALPHRNFPADPGPSPTHISSDTFAGMTSDTSAIDSVAEAILAVLVSALFDASPDFPPRSLPDMPRARPVGASPSVSTLSSQSAKAPWRAPVWAVCMPHASQRREHARWLRGSCTRCVLPGCVRALAGRK